MTIAFKQRMADLNLIPFGLNPDNGSLLDVGDVPRGKACGCICLSCQTPLIAHQGNVKKWHFAHASRDVYEQTQQECDYSFYMSLRMMARQIVKESLEFEMPEYISNVVKYIDGTFKYIEVPFTITKQQKIALNKIEIEKPFLGIPVDIQGYVKTTPFVIYFTHPKRSIPNDLIKPENAKCGIISIALDKVAIQFSNARRNETPYKKVLQDFLATDLDSKTWVFHPNYESLEAKAHLKLDALELDRLKGLRELNALDTKRLKPLPNRKFSASASRPLNQYDEFIPKESPKAQRKRRGNFECVVCRSRWQDYRPGVNNCPKCSTHLYTRFIDYVEE